MRSYVPDYDLVTISSVAEAVALLGSNQGWRPIAGGTDLMVLLNAGKLPFQKLLSIREIPALRRIEVDETQVWLGAAVTYTNIRGNALLQSEFPLLCTAASWTGGIANQNRGTLGGNIVNASPAADSPPALLVYDAELKLVSARGERWIRYGEFHTGYKQIDMRPDELLCEIRLPRRKQGWRQYSRKVGPRKAQAISKVCVAAAAQVNDGVMEDVRIAIGSVAPVPLRCVVTEAVLRGAAVRPQVLAKACEAIRAEIQPITDIRSTHEYRAQVSVNLLSEFVHGLGVK
jgi:CO/xanthine dehydrogenase FAD-binding subunit